MSDVTPEALARRIHDSGTRLVLSITGGGSEAIGQLLAVPGGSRSLLEAIVPYSSAALDAFLGAPPEQYCSERTARAMAMGAFERARRYAPGVEFLAGVGCTASLASDQPKRGPHRAHVALQTASVTASCLLELEKGARSRADEERLVSRLILNALAEACGVTEQLTLELLNSERPVRQRCMAPPAWQELLAGRRLAICQSGRGEPPAALLPGAFNLRHQAHVEMARVAAEILGRPVAYELSIENVDKPLLDYRELQLRSAEFAADDTLWLTRAPTFVEKARLFPGATFVVGADTIRRIADPKYYGGTPEARDRGIAELAAQRARFLVFGRREDEGFRSVDDLNLPPTLRALCQGVPEERFRMDLSSTELRQTPGDES